MWQLRKPTLILAEPGPSQGDIHFRLLGIPVRVHPFFWVISLLIGLQSDPLPSNVLLWVIAMMVSILAHEIGHALIQRHYGGHPQIVLHGLGGLAICGDCNRSTRSQILISLAGPGAGFSLAALIAIGISLVGHPVGLYSLPQSNPFDNPDGLRLFGIWLIWEGFGSPHVNLMLQNLFFINILWGAINLLPIYPLDGGQVAREICLLGNPRSGMILSLQISMVTAIGMVLVGLSLKSFFVAIMFGYFAFSSYKTMEAYRASSWQP